MGKSERAKGLKAEQEVARIFRAHGLDVQRTPNSGGLHVHGDIQGVPGFHIEVKRQEVLRLPLWRRQAEAECGDLVPVVVYRRSAPDFKPRNPWIVSERMADGAWDDVTLDDFLAELQTAPMQHAGSSPEAAPATRETGA